MIKISLFTIMTCTTIHMSFAGGYWSQPATEEQVTLPNAQILTERIKKTDCSTLFIQEIDFIPTFEQKKFTTEQASQKIDTQITSLWNKMKNNIPDPDRPLAKKQLDEQIKHIKPLLLGVLFADFPEQLQKIEGKK